MKRLRKPWLMVTAGAVAGGLLVLLLVPRQTPAADVDPCCATTAIGIGTLNGLTKKLLSKPLGQVKDLKNSYLKFLNDDVWSARSIALGKSFSTQVDGMVSKVRGVMQIPVASSKLPSSRQLEDVVLSKDSSRAGEVDSSFEGVYGDVPSVDGAPPDLRDRIDMCDAAAKAALKRSLVIEELAAKQEEVVAKLNSKIGAAAAGTAPMIEASAATHLVRANSYTLAAFSDWVRLRSIAAGDETAETKRTHRIAMQEYEKIRKGLTTGTE